METLIYFPFPSKHPLFSLKTTLGIIALTLSIVLSAMIFSSCDDSPSIDDENILKFKDATAESGLERFSESFGAVFADIDNDSDDDLIVSNHGLFIPSLYLNKNGSFEDLSRLFRLIRPRDWHGITVVDLDNDGDKDIAIAGGGGGGIKKGAPNLLFRSMLRETGGLTFAKIAKEVDIIKQRWRGRHFLPIASRDGATVDLYFVCRPRTNMTNLYFRNTSLVDDIILKPADSSGLSIQLSQDGRGDCFLDFDRDGDRDFFVIDNGHLVLYENKNTYFFRNNAHFRRTKRVETFGVGDLNRDGYPDLYVGTRAKNSGSDNISFGALGEERKLNFVVRNRSNNNETDKRDRVDFKSKSSAIHIGFIMVPGLSEDDPSDIFIGRNNLNPPSREATISAETAEGEPKISAPGTYLWNSGSGQWSIIWLYSKSLKEEHGVITASSIYDIEPKMLETFPKEETSDQIFINQRGLAFRELKAIELNHFFITRAVAIDDFNNDGWPDIIGIRGNEPGAYNGEPFIIYNHGRLNLKPQRAISLKNKDDDIGQADQMVVGLANQDGLLDIFMTNGYGLNPGNVGPYKLFINHTKTANNYTILELEGRSSNRDALGAQVSLYTEEGTFIGYRELGAGYNRMQSSHKLHFGLGLYRGIIKAHILWPSGIEQIVEVKPNRINHIIED